MLFWGQISLARLSQLLLLFWCVSRSCISCTQQIKIILLLLVVHETTQIKLNSCTSSLRECHFAETSGSEVAAKPRVRRVSKGW